MKNIYTLFKMNNPEVKTLASNPHADYTQQIQACLSLAEHALQEAERRKYDETPYKKVRQAGYINKSYQWFKQAQTIGEKNNDSSKAHLARQKADTLFPLLKEATQCFYGI